MTLDQLLDSIRGGKVPPIILVGGSSDYLVAEAFTSIRDTILTLDSSVKVEGFSETADLSSVLDSFRTFSLFGGRRLMLVPEVNAFVTRAEIKSLFEKAINDWSTAKTDRKRSSSVAKLLHILGLIGRDVDDGDATIAQALGLRDTTSVLVEMLSFARVGGRHATRGEADAALLVEAATQGGAPGTTLLLKTGDIPEDSATVAAIARAGVVIQRNLTREEFARALARALTELVAENEVTIDSSAVTVLRQRLGIDRILADKFSKELPDLRSAVSEAERLANYVGRGGRITAQIVEQQISAISGGARYELASLFAERKGAEALSKLRDLVAEARRDDPKTLPDIHYGKFLFTLADEVRQLIGILSFARARRINLGQRMKYDRFKEGLADELGEYLKTAGLVRQRPHPFALHKRFEAARLHRQSDLLRILDQIAEIEFSRKCGGLSAELGIESLLLDLASFSHTVS